MMRLAILQAQAEVLDVEANLAVVAKAAEQARAQGAELLLTPELFVLGYAPSRLGAELDVAQLPVIREQLAAIARQAGLGLLYSLVEEGPRGDPQEPGETAGGTAGDSAWYIGATLLGPDGHELAHYRKAHLFGPQEQATFTPGEQRPAVVPFAGLKLGIMICYDVEFPETVRDAAVQGAQLILVPTALASGYPKIQQVIIPARALESQVYLAYANHVGLEDGLELAGHSVLASPTGELVAQAGAEPQLLIADIDPDVLAAARADVPYLSERRPGLYPGWQSKG